jgi:hypothetical protein
MAIPDAVLNRGQDHGASANLVVCSGRGPPPDGFGTYALGELQSKEDVR